MFNKHLATFGTTIGLLLSSQVPVKAFIDATFTFDAIVPFGPFAGEVGTGSFSYDIGLIEPVGFDSINPTEGLLLDLSILGQTFTESDDTNFPGFPVIEFTNGVPDFIDFIIDEFSFDNPVPIDEPGVDAIFVQSLLFPGSPIPGSSADFSALAFISIPEPATVLSLLAFSLGGITIRQKKLS